MGPGPDMKDTNAFRKTKKGDFLWKLASPTVLFFSPAFPFPSAPLYPLVFSPPRAFYSCRINRYSAQNRQTDATGARAESKGQKDIYTSASNRRRRHKEEDKDAMKEERANIDEVERPGDITYVLLRQH
jgi:hypothetical protein